MLVLINDIRDVRDIGEVMERERITIWNSVPAIMDLMLEVDVTDEENEALRLCC